MNKNKLSIGILVGFLAITILIPITNAPIVNFPTGWDCSNIAVYVFKQEKQLGHDPTIVYGQNFSSTEGHAWVEDIHGVVLTGELGMGRKELYERFPFIIRYKKSPEGTVEWVNEWDTVF